MNGNHRDRTNLPLRVDEIFIHLRNSLNRANRNNGLNRIIIIINRSSIISQFRAQKEKITIRPFAPHFANNTSPHVTYLYWTLNIRLTEFSLFRYVHTILTYDAHWCAPLIQTRTRRRVSKIWTKFFSPLMCLFVRINAPFNLPRIRILISFDSYRFNQLWNFFFFSLFLFFYPCWKLLEILEEEEEEKKKIWRKLLTFNGRGKNIIWEVFFGSFNIFFTLERRIKLDTFFTFSIYIYYK